MTFEIDFIEKMVMTPLFQDVSFVLQLIASIATIISAIVAVWNEKNNGRPLSMRSEGSSLGHKEVFPFIKGLLISSFILYCGATFVLLYWAEVNDLYLYSTIGTFVLMSVFFILLSIAARRSLYSRTIIAPKKLWQMMFNRIPEYLEECDGPFKIYLIRIGLDDENAPKNSVNLKILRKVRKKIAAIKKSKRGQTFRDDKTPLYDIVENDDLFYHRSDIENIHGIIVFIGNQIETNEASNCLRILADKFPNASIGYCSYGTFPYGETSPYVNLGRLRTKDYIDHLIFRYYVRSRAWRGLSKAYFKAFWILGGLVAFFLLMIPIKKIGDNYKSTKGMLVLSAPKEQKNESDYTRLVNTLLLSPRPYDVKLWKRDDLGKAVHNYFRFSEEGHHSGIKYEPNLISEVIDAKVFLLYDTSRECPYIVWNCGGERVNGVYHPDNDSLTVRINGVQHGFKWQPSRNGYITADDRNIRVVYSYQDNIAVEIIYGEGDGDRVREAVRNSNTFLLEIQQFIIAATLSGLHRENQEKDSVGN